MSWKKGVLSYLTWFIYTIAAGGAAAGIAGAFCGRAGIAAYWGALFAAILFLAVGNLVFWIHRHARSLAAFVERNRGLLKALEVFAAAVLLGAGIMLRAQGIMDAAGQTSDYFEAAKVAEGQRIPQMVHGAVYYYVQMLHALFLLVGNHFQAALWLQVALQLLASLILFSVVRRLAGSAAALAVLGFCACSPYMVRNALNLSPVNLLFCILAAAAWLAAAWSGRRLKPPLFFLAGIPVAFCCYIDISGIMLLFFVLASAFRTRSEPASRARRAAAAFLCLAGTFAVFFLMICVDALASGKELGGVLQAWWLLYRPEAFRIPFSADISGPELENLLLAALMAFGVFSFWCSGREESMSGWTLGAIGTAAAECWGIFTEEAPGSFFLFLLVVVLAAAGFGQSFGIAHEKCGAGDGNGLPETKAGQEKAASGAEGLIGAERSAIGGSNPMEKQNAQPQEPAEEERRQVRYIENPLPLPKKHEKRVLDYPSCPAAEEDDFDYPVSDEDDFDI